MNPHVALAGVKLARAKGAAQQTPIKNNMKTFSYDNQTCNKLDYEGEGECPDYLLKSKKQAFETWMFDGVRYLAIPLDGRVHVISQDGSNFGSWFDVQSFRKRQQSQSPQEWMALGMAFLMPPVPN